MLKLRHRRWRRCVVPALLVGGASCGLVAPPVPSPPSATDPAPPAVSASASASAAPSASADHLPPLPAQGRPVQPVPALRLPGFTQPPTGHGLGRYRGQRLNWRDCQPLQCAELVVPLDYAAPDATAITLRVVRQPVPREARRNLLVNFGGPGAPSESALAGFQLPGLEGTAIVSWDVRGSGGSTPVRCWDDPRMDAFQRLDFSPDTGAEDAALVEQSRRFGLACLAKSGPLLGHVSTAESVRDLDLVRSALGTDTVDYLGYSNGTLLGAGYAHLFGQHVGRMVLDGATNFGGSAVSQAAGFERALNRMDEWCRRTRCLPSQDDAVVATVSRLLTRLDSEPLRLADRTLTQSLALTGIAAVMYAGERGWPALARALAAAQDGDPGPLLSLSDLLTTRDANGHYEQFAYAFPASSCADDEAESLAEARAQSRRRNSQAPILGPFWGPDVLCALWPVNPPDRLPRLTASQAPTLVVIGTTGDPATPYEWSMAAARQLRHAVLVTNEGDGHTSGQDQECLTQVVVPYLEHGTVPADGARC